MLSACAGAGLTAALQAAGAGALALPVHLERHTPAGRQHSIRTSAQHANKAAAYNAASCSGWCTCCHLQLQQQSGCAAPERCAACSLRCNAAKAHCSVSAFSRSHRLQGQPQTAARHAVPNVRCAAADRNGDAAEQDSLRQSRDSKLPSPPHPSAAEQTPQGTRQALQEMPQSAEDVQHGGSLSDAEQQQAMTVAIQKGLAKLQRNQLGIPGPRQHNGSSGQPPPPLRPSPAAADGVKAALAFLQQHDTPTTRNGPSTAGASPANGAPTAVPPKPSAAHPPQQQRAQPGQPAKPSLPADGHSQGVDMPFGPQLPTEPPLPREKWPPRIPEPPSPPSPPAPKPTRPLVVEQDVRWYVEWRKRLPFPLNWAEASAERAVLTRPWLHRCILWCGGTVGLAGKLVAPSWHEAVSTTAAVLASIVALCAMVTAIDGFWLATYRAYERFGGMSGWRDLIAGQLDARLGLRAEHATGAWATLQPYLEGVALAGVALLGVALMKWTWRTWMPSSGSACGRGRSGSSNQQQQT